MSEPTHPLNVWINVAAALKNPQLRQALAQVLADPATNTDTDTGQPSAPRRKALARWEQIGLIHRSDEGGWQINDELLTRTLAAASEARSDRQGIQRFFTGGKLHTLPAKPADRLEVMQYLRDAVVEPGETLREEQLNERLRVFHPDTALIRRYLVDHGLILRAVDGSNYRRGPSAQAQSEVTAHSPE